MLCLQFPTGALVVDWWIQAHCLVLMVLNSRLLYFDSNPSCFSGMNLQLDLSTTACPFDVCKEKSKKRGILVKNLLLKNDYFTKKRKGIHHY